MSKIYTVKCDRCGAKSDDTKGWIRLSARCGQQHNRDFQATGMLSSNSTSTYIDVTGANAAHFTEADFCSASCAGLFLFNAAFPAKAPTP